MDNKQNSKIIKAIKVIKEENSNNRSLKIIDTPIDESLSPWEILIKIKAVGLNHRDLHAIQNFSDFIIGSDASGIVKKVGKCVSNFKVNDKVIINPVTNWNYPASPPKEPNIIGGPSNGVFSEYVKINQKHVFLKPCQLSWEEAATLPLAGLTSYRNLFTKGRIEKNQMILITGISGGVSLLMAQMAKQLNCKVIGTSRNDSQDLEYVDKIVNTNSNFKKTIGDSNIDLILDNLGGALFSDYIEVIKPNGKIISFGNSMEEKINLSTRDLFYKQVNILGSSVGSKKEFIDMLSFVKNNNITPFVEYIFEFDKFLDAINLLKSKNYKGNIAIVL